MHERECCGLLRGLELSLSDEADEELVEEEDVEDEEDEDENEEEDEKVDED